MVLLIYDGDFPKSHQLHGRPTIRTQFHGPCKEPMEPTLVHIVPLHLHKPKCGITSRLELHGPRGRPWCFTWLLCCSTLYPASSRRFTRSLGIARTMVVPVWAHLSSFLHIARISMPSPFSCNSTQNKTSNPQNCLRTPKNPMFKAS